ncbi:hypothetical protein ABEY43_19715 [Priestia megaterium]|uniref:hypothetical protein n=1 Tax=Priestia megaterium TaxID=1404 RepID=UPI002E1AE88D|nr:hypothetical protein [Priestia megaterium]
MEYESYWAICLFLFLIFVFGSITELFSKTLIFLMKSARLNRVLFVTSAAHHIKLQS